jgi:hypothetical protein
MPRDPNRPYRLPSVTAKVHQITGFSPAEKALFTRIANLIDTYVVTQRQENNPGQVAGRKFTTTIPTPIGLTTSIVTGGLTVQWDAVNFNDFYAYELQYDETTSFSSPVVLQVSTTQITLKDDFSADIFVRVRTLSRKGEVSGWSSTANITVVNTIYDTDTDQIEPENRTNVQTRPTLLGAEIATNTGDLAFVGVGGAVGPGPQNFQDTTIQAELNIRNQITYTIREGVLIGGQRTMVMPDNIVEVASFYTFDPQFYIRTLPLTGSFVDFFDNYGYQTTPSTLDVEMLRYLRFYGHHQSGIVLNATHTALKH